MKIKLKDIKNFSYIKVIFIDEIKVLEWFEKVKRKIKNFSYIKVIFIDEIKVSKWFKKAKKEIKK